MARWVRTRTVVLLLALAVGSAALAEEPIEVPTWQDFMEDFATTTVPAAAMATLPAPIGTLASTLFASDDATRVTLLLWLHRKSIDAVVAGAWDAHERYEAFFVCLASGACDRLDEMLAVDPATGEPIAGPAASGWRVVEDTPLRPRCAEERLTLDVPGDRRLVVRFAREGQPDVEAGFAWSEPYVDDDWLWIDLEMVGTNAPITARLIATFAHGATFERRMSTFSVGAVDGESTRESPGIPITAGVDEVTVTLDVHTTIRCGATFEDNQVQRYVVRSVD